MIDATFVAAAVSKVSVYRSFAEIAVAKEQPTGSALCALAGKPVGFVFFKIAVLAFEDTKRSCINFRCGHGCTPQ
jgi:hypothetical protein